MLNKFASSLLYTSSQSISARFSLNLFSLSSDSTQNPVCLACTNVVGLERWEIKVNIGKSSDSVSGITVSDLSECTFEK